MARECGAGNSRGEVGDRSESGRALGGGEGREKKYRETQK